MSTPAKPPRGLRQSVLEWFHERPQATPWFLLAPGGLWLIIFFLVPIGIMFAYSFMPKGLYGGVERGFTLEHYLRFGDRLYLTILWRTIVDSSACTIICLLLGYPTAYVIARGGKWKDTLLFLVVLPFWTSFLVRTFAMIFLMRDGGFINTMLIKAGLIEEPISMLYTPFAVMMGLVYGFVPFMVLPIYASLEKLDLSLLEAAEVLGARSTKRFLRVTLPLSMPGVVAGSLLAHGIGSLMGNRNETHAADNTPVPPGGGTLVETDYGASAADADGGYVADDFDPGDSGAA